MADRKRVDPGSFEIGFASEMDAFGLDFCQGLGLGLHARPLISRLGSFTEPIEIKAGMVFAVETYSPRERRRVGGAHRGGSDPHPSGPQVISLYPAQELPIANRC